MSRMRTVKPVLPIEISKADGLAYSLWHPSPPGHVRGAVLILHGAGSCKESHHDYARAAVASGFAALGFDQRGHGESDGPMDGRVLDDIAAMADLLRARAGGPTTALAVRGSSMGGYLAISAASRIDAKAVVAICPASASGLARGLERGALGFDADVSALTKLLQDNDAQLAVAGLDVPVLLLHAEGDEQVPVQHSRELAMRFGHPRSRLIAVPGGHHRSIQHDAEMQAISLRFIEEALAGASG